MNFLSEPEYFLSDLYCYLVITSGLDFDFDLNLNFN
jgi:hypothetical protein